jgi:hypothetical protein
MKIQGPKTIFECINDLSPQQWNYYGRTMGKPFVDNQDFRTFIEKYFKRGGKIEVFKSCDIKTDQLRLPNHICSVFFMGILIYYNTSLKGKYKIENNDPGYQTFPFIWFLIALFHDNAYQMEDESKLTGVSTLEELYQYFDIEHTLLDTKFKRCKDFLDMRENYFNYRKKEWGVIDHGILGGILLYDRLVKIRRNKKRHNEDDLFWGKKLENQYKLAANAISIHNIWIPDKDSQELYEQYNLTALVNFKPVKFKDFPLFYLLGIVDTIEPLKVYRNENHDSIYILKNITMNFGRNFIQIRNIPGSKLDFQKMIDQLKYFEGWLDIDVKCGPSFLELRFN